MNGTLLMLENSCQYCSCSQIPSHEIRSVSEHVPLLHCSPHNYVSMLLLMLVLIMLVFKELIMGTKDDVDFFIT